MTSQIRNVTRPPPPLPCTNRASLVPPLVLSGHAASLGEGLRGGTGGGRKAGRGHRTHLGALGVPRVGRGRALSALAVERAAARVALCSQIDAAHVDAYLASRALEELSRPLGAPRKLATVESMSGKCALAFHVRSATSERVVTLRGDQGSGTQARGAPPQSGLRRSSGAARCVQWWAAQRGGGRYAPPPPAATAPERP